MFSFTARKKRLEVQRFLRRVIDTTTPNLIPCNGDLREENRSNRSTPVLLIPLDDESDLAERSVCAVTKDLSGNGVALVLASRFPGQRVVIGFMVQSLPGFALGEVRQNVPLGGGFWQLGVELLELTGPEAHPSLEAMIPFVEQLTPRDEDQPVPAAAE